MEIILILLTSGILSALFCFSYYLGYKNGQENKKSDGMLLDKSNANEINEILKWRNYEGR